jgi:peroxiredoxin Q/BCP
MALKVGDKAPDFALESDDGKQVSLKDLSGKRVVLYFYPKDSTPGCTREACGFRDLKSAFAKKGAVILGVSRDSLASHGKFREKYELNFPLLSDPETKVMKAYGAWGEKVLYGKKITGTIRTTVLIGKDGKVERIWPKVKVDGHMDEVLNSLA